MKTLLLVVLVALLGLALIVSGEVLSWRHGDWWVWILAQPYVGALLWGWLWFLKSDGRSSWRHWTYQRLQNTLPLPPMGQAFVWDGKQLLLKRFDQSGFQDALSQHERLQQNTIADHVLSQPFDALYRALHQPGRYTHDNVLIVFAHEKGAMPVMMGPYWLKEGHEDYEFYSDILHAWDKGRRFDRYWSAPSWMKQDD